MYSHIFSIAFTSIPFRRLYHLDLQNYAFTCQESSRVDARGHETSYECKIIILRILRGNENSVILEETR